MGKKGSGCFHGNNGFEDELYKTLEGMTGKYDFRTVFTDFVRYAALYLGNLCEPIHLEERHKEYENLLEKYGDEKEKMHSCLVLLTKSAQQNVEMDGPKDILGNIFEHIGMSNAAAGQFFTPEHISEFMAEIMLCDKETELNGEKKYTTVSDPCIGSGRMLLSFAKALHKRNYNYCEQMVAFAVDIDFLCAAMAYVQFCIYGIPAVVVHGNSLSLQEWSRWYTPVYVWGHWVFREPMRLTDCIAEDDKKLRQWTIDLFLFKKERLSTKQPEAEEMLIAN